MNTFRLVQAEPIELGIRVAKNAPSIVLEAVEPSLATQIIVMLPTIIAILSLIGLGVLWIVAFFQVLLRKDLKEHKVMWIVLLLLVAPIGLVAYFFTENRRKFGIWSVVAMVLIFLALPLYAIMAFVALQG